MLLDDTRRCALCHIPFDPGLDCIEQALVAERLGKEINRTDLHRFDCHWHVGMPGEENDQSSNSFVEPKQAASRPTDSYELLDRQADPFIVIDDKYKRAMHISLPIVLSNRSLQTPVSVSGK